MSSAKNDDNDAISDEAIGDGDLMNEDVDDNNDNSVEDENTTNITRLVFDERLRELMNSADVAHDAFEKDMDAAEKISFCARSCHN